ncbi:MAG: S8 family peptidase [Cytophagales bacterium]|nr:S8 family peptidase [Cytophagales bacterium]
MTLVYKLILINFILIASLKIGFSQDKRLYYYYRGEKINLILDESRINVVSKMILNQNIETGKIKIIRSRLESSKYSSQRVSEAVVENQNSSFNNLIAEISKSSENLSVCLFYKVNENLSIGTSNTFYVRLKEKERTEELQNLSEKLDVEILGPIVAMEDWYALRLNYGSRLTSVEASNYFYETQLFEDVDPGFEFRFESSCTNDPDFGSLWGLSNASNPAVDINACQAWGITQGANVKIAIVDKGIEKTHVDLSANISSLSFNSQTGSSPSLAPNGNGHGTQVGGVIAAIKDNGTLITGLAPQAKLISVSNPVSPNSTIAAELASGISWAWQNGADIINNSWGDFNGLYYQYFHSSILETAITNAMNLGRNGKGSLVVFSAGNTGVAVDYPANFDSNIIVVGAITSTGLRWGLSGYGQTLDLVAPGSSILTLSNYNVTVGSYVFNSSMFDSGTSFAAPHVTGVLALMLAVNPNLTRCQAVNILESTAQKIGGYSYATTTGRSNGTWNNEMGYGLIDAHAAVLAAQSTTDSLPVVNGAGLICTSQSYSVGNAPLGSTFSWSSSYTSGLTVNSSGIATRVSAHCGQVTLTALVNTNGCTAPATKSIWVGSPVITNQRLDGMSYYSPTYICPGNHWLQVTPVGQGATNALWTVQSGVPHIATPNYLDFTLYSNVSSIAITARSQNSCGLGPNAAFYLMRKDWGCSGSFSIAAYPNPAANELVVEVMSNVTDAINPFVISSAYIIDENGVTVSDGKENNGKQRFDTSKLKKGVYYLHVQIGGEHFKERILIE